MKEQLYRTNRKGSPLWIGVLLFLLCGAFTGCTSKKEVDRKRNLDDNWSFYRGVIDEASLPALDDSGWRIIDLPHDWSVEPVPKPTTGDIGPFSRQSKHGIATGHTLGGEGWYQKRFTLVPQESDKCITLYFEGIYMESDVWVNGRHVGFHPYGYTSFLYDITDFCHPPGQENKITVRVRNEGKNTRWYSGSGIYRHVWLLATDKVFLTEWGTWVKTPVVEDHKAEIEILSELENKSQQSETVTVKATVLDPNNTSRGESFRKITIPAGKKAVVTNRITITGPKRWSVDVPNLYTADVSIVGAGKQKDRKQVSFGIRTIEFSAKEGFKLNGMPMMLKGGCVHHDNGLLGAIAIDRAEERKVELLKANGYNAVRCAHNPPSEAFLDACDRLGLFVIDEAFDHWTKAKNPDDYHRFFNEWSERDLTSMVLRDRHHPSIIMWSIGNEVPERADDIGVKIAKQLKSIILHHDDTRPVTAAICDFWDNPHYKWEQSAKAFSTLDVSGYNYVWWQYENDMKLFPGRIIYGSETTAGEAALNWDMAEKHPAIIGEFVWTAIDYLGESGIGHAFPLAPGETEPPQFIDWPWFNAWCGDIDLCGDKKPQSYYRDVIWHRSPIEMAVHTPLPKGGREKVSYWGWPDEMASWNWEGCEGNGMSVNVYTRYPSTRLYLNGELLGEKEVSSKSKYTATFVVPYAPGELKAVGMENGMEKESKLLHTSGRPALIRLTADRTHLTNSRNDLAYVKMEIVDKKGYVVPDSNVELQLSLAGAGKIAASGNACPTNMESFRSLTPRVFHGKALVILQPEPGHYPAGGEMILSVTSEGLPTATLAIQVK